LEELPFYWAMMEKTKAAVGDFYVGIGLEADFHPGTEYFVRRLRQSYNYDYVIGSVHFIGAWPFDSPHHYHDFEERDVGEIYQEYFRLIVGAARSGLYHSIGHLDLPKKFGHMPEGGYLDLAEEALQVIAGQGLALDVNTAGWRKPISELYPSPAVLARARQLGIPVVLGSDAHKPSEVGHRFADAVQVLKSAGYSEASYFKAGKRLEYSL
jgi:histidinol-phosphatase (PHP family)